MTFMECRYMEFVDTNTIIIIQFGNTIFILTLKKKIEKLQKTRPTRFIL